MDQSNQRTSRSVGSILQVTKNIIQQNENFYDYYINKDNSLYHKQLPLLVRRTKLQALVLYNKESKKQQDNNYPLTLNQSQELLDDIRNAQIRSKKLPPLCPFYNEKGELVPSVVKTSRVYNRYNFDQIERMNTIDGRGTRRILKKISKKNGINVINTIDNLEKIEKDYFNFNQVDYDKLKYDEKDIFGKKQFYIDLINKKIEEFKNKEITEENREYKKDKIFEKSGKKKKISLTLDSICVQIFPSDVSNNSNDKSNSVNPIFEYNLPFSLLPLFYYKGEEKFKIFLSKIIDWDNSNKKFILNENQEKLYQDILKNCKDFQEVSQSISKKFDKLKSDEIRQTKTRFAPSTSNKTSSKLKKDTLISRQVSSNVETKEDHGVTQKSSNKTSKFKKDTIILRQPSSNVQTKEDHGFSQTMPNQVSNTYLTNVGDESNRYNIKSSKSIYPSPKENNYINYNEFKFLWLTPNDAFNVTIKMPLITFVVPKNNITVKKYIDFELLFYLYQNDFSFWDFFIVKYLTSFKSFRSLLEDINAIHEISNKKFYLTYPKIKSYSFNNYKFVNIVSIRHKDILDNFIDGLKNSSEEKKENKIKNDNDNNKENTNNAETNNTEPKTKDEATQISKVEEKLHTSTLIQKSFIAIIRFADNKTLMADEFKIYFNFSQFQKFQKLEKFIDKISFLIKFIDINYIHKKVNINYKYLDSFNENEWIKDFEQYNYQYLNTLGNTSSPNLSKDFQRIFSEFSGITKNTSIQIEIFRPLSIVRTLNENGSIKTEKNVLNNNIMEKSIEVENDDIKGMARIFYENYEENEKNNNGNK